MKKNYDHFQIDLENVNFHIDLEPFHPIFKLCAHLFWMIPRQTITMCYISWLMFKVMLNSAYFSACCIMLMIVYYAMTRYQICCSVIVGTTFVLCSSPIFFVCCHYLVLKVSCVVLCFGINIILRVRLCLRIHTLRIIVYMTVFLSFQIQLPGVISLFRKNSFSCLSFCSHHIPFFHFSTLCCTLYMLFLL